MKPAALVASAMPPPLLLRAAAWGFRLRREQRLLLLDDLVPRGGVAVDVGAWWGPWTYWLARRAAVVHSFEPNPVMAAHLRRVAAANVEVHELALSDRRRSSTLWASPVPGADALGTLEVEHRQADARPFPVRLSPLDDLDLPPVDFVKIDAEGHEVAVLRGAERTLRRSRPVLLVEIEQRLHDGPIDQTFDWLADLGYRGWFRRDRRWAPLAAFDVERDQLATQGDVKSLAYVNNFVFTPGPEAPAHRRS